MGLNMFANPIITPVIILYNIKSLEFICFNTFENANIDKTIPKLTATTRTANGTPYTINRI